MDRTRQPSLPMGRFGQVLFVLMSITLLGGFIFSIISSLGLCDSECNQTKFYRFFGQPFALIGLFFFSSAFLVHWVSPSYHRLHLMLGCMIFGALGAELHFLGIQKFEIGHWCPLCVTVASVVALALLLYVGEAWTRRKNLNNDGYQENKMKKYLKNGTLFFLSAGIGLFLAFTGISKPDYAARAADTMKDRVEFGNTKSPIEVYFISDWFCPSCKKVEPEIERIAPLIIGKASLFFIDYAVHQESYNFAHFNLAFMANDKTSYMKARHLLALLATEAKTPTQADVERLARAANIPFKPLSYSEVRAGIDYFEKVAKKYNVEGTPTLLIVNTRNGKEKEFRGSSQITQENVMGAIDAMIRG